MSDDLNVKLIGPAPEHIEFNPAQYTKYGAGYQVISFPLPLDDEKFAKFQGEWKLVLNRADERSQGFEYGLIAMMDNQKIASKYGFDGSDFGTGEVIPLRVDLREGGKPILNAKVSAKVASPDNGVGNILSRNSTRLHKATPAVTLSAAATTSQIDLLSPVEKKLEALLLDPEIRAQLMPSARPDVTLEDGDGDGIYTGQYSNTNQEGIYSFTFMVEGNTPDNGGFTRTQKLTANVRPKPDPSNTDMNVTIADTQGEQARVAILTLTPFDKFGNYMGPGYADFIKVDVDAKLIGDVVDNLDGTYTQKIALSGVFDYPRISVTLRGEVLVIDQWLIDPPWHWLVLLILLLVVIIFLIRKKSGKP